MKIELKSLKFKNFGAFCGQHEFIPPTDGSHMIIGINSDTGGSNGTGKTTFVKAIAALVCGHSVTNLPVKELRSHGTDEPTEISGTIVVDGKELCIHRVIGGKTTASYDNQLITGKQDEIQDKIYGILKLSKEQFLHLSYKEQGAFGGFLLKGDQEKKDFLGEFFGISDLERIRDAAMSEVKSLQANRNKLMESLGGYQAKIDLMSSKTQWISDKITDMTSEDNCKTLQLERDEINTLLLQIDSANKIAMGDPDYVAAALASDPTFNSMRDTLEADRGAATKTIEAKRTELASVDQQLADIPDRSSLIMELQAKKNEVQSKLNNALASKLAASDVSRRAESLAVQIHQLEAAPRHLSTCPTCKQALDKGGADSVFESFNRELQQKRSDLQAAMTEIDRLNNLADKSGDHKAELDSIEGQLAQLNDDTRARLLERRGHIMATIASAEKAVAAAATTMDEIRRRAVIAAKESVKSLNRLVAAKQDKISSHSAELANLKNQLSEVSKSSAGCFASLEKLQTEMQLIDVEISTSQKVAEVLSKEGFIGHIFDTALSELTDESNKNLKDIPNSSNLTIEFVSDKVVKSTGNINKTIQCRIWSSGQEIMYDSLSGGEKLSLTLAIDEALDDILERRIGVKIGWKILDEQLIFTDVNSKEPILEFFDRRSSGKTYFIIDHSSEINASGKKQIFIEKKSGVSRIGGAT